MQLDLEGGCNAAKSQDLEVWGCFRSPPLLPEVLMILLALFTESPKTVCKSPVLDRNWTPRTVLFQGHKDERRGCQASCTEIAFCESGRAIEASTTARRYPAKDCWLSPRRIPGLGCRTRMRAPATCAPQSSVHRAALGDNHRRPTFPSRKPTDLCSMQRSSQ